MENVHEEWRDVKGYEGRYQVSDLGRVRSVATGKCLAQHANNKGYVCVGLWCNYARKLATVHRLVASAFVREPLAGEQVDHIDCDKRNNRAGNLEWVDAATNRRRAMANGLHVNPVGKHHGRCRSTEEQVRVAVALVRGGMSKAAAARRVGQSEWWIRAVYKNQTWKHLNLNLRNA